MSIKALTATKVVMDFKYINIEMGMVLTTCCSDKFSKVPLNESKTSTNCKNLLIPQINSGTLASIKKHFTQKDIIKTDFSGNAIHLK